MTTNPAQIVVAEGRARHDEETILPEASHREVALDPAAAVEHVRVRDAADGPIHIVGAQALEKGERAGSADLNLGEAGLVIEGGGLARRQRLSANGRGPVLSGPAARTERLLAPAGVRFDP